MYSVLYFCAALLYNKVNYDIMNNGDTRIFPFSLVQNNRIQVTPVKLPLRSLRMREGSDIVTHQKPAELQDHSASRMWHIASLDFQHTAPPYDNNSSSTESQNDRWRSNSDKDHFSSYTRYILLRCRLFLKNNENGSSKRYITISNKVTEQNFHRIRQWISKQR